MLKRLVTFLNNNYPNSNIDEYLDAKYLHLTGEQLKQIAEAIEKGELEPRTASSCTADKFIFHFGETIILCQRDNTESITMYKAELSWETDFLAIHSTRNKGKGFYFIAFEFDDNYQVTLKDTDKFLDDQVVNMEKNMDILEKAMPVLKGFMFAISE
ncbi:MAG TPA: hypothetical protein EYP92_02320 [Candidatus Thioglobus sp.]|jgi:hypothetical protein|nr:hypothetical protein [Candidatus Thioglobus sp.]HIL42510.1 hypothetical protein [Gammaproteobacteria bacterium]